jgi:hypothetical protein
MCCQDKKVPLSKGEGRNGGTHCELIQSQLFILKNLPYPSFLKRDEAISPYGKRGIKGDSKYFAWVKSVSIVSASA